MDILEMGLTNQQTHSTARTKRQADF
jgi:hypothetical protein